MASLSKVNISIVLVTIFIINIFNTSAIEIINGKYSLDSQIDPIINKQECDSYYTGNNKLCDMNKCHVRFILGFHRFKLDICIHLLQKSLIA